jgi:predicted nucleic acid-binding protein
LKKIYVDSNIFVDAEVPERKHHQKSKEFLEQVLHRNDIRVFTSIFTLLEIASAIRRQIGRRDVYRYLYNIQRKYKEGQVIWLPPTRKHIPFEDLIRDLIETAIVNATPSGDTIHIHTMISHKIKTIITWDKHHFQEVRGKKEVLTPEEFLSKLQLFKQEK